MRCRREDGEASYPAGFATQRSGRSPQCRPPMGLVRRDQGARRKSMPEHRRRRATQRSATTPIGPKGYSAASRLVSRPRKRVAVRRHMPATATARFHCRVVGGMGPASSLPLLGDGGTSPSSRRLESGPMTHATDGAGDPGRTSGSQTPLDTAPRRPRDDTSRIMRARFSSRPEEGETRAWLIMSVRRGSAGCC